jgi:hypothetical protein
MTTQTFDGLIESLNRSMLEDYTAVNPQKNPIMLLTAHLTVPQLTFILQQYSIFPRELIGFIEMARDAALEAGWLTVAEVLSENIAEELGSETQGISHAELLANGLEMGLNVPVAATPSSEATLVLLKALRIVFEQPVSYVLGAMYAVESTSISELQLVQSLAEFLMEGAIPKPLHYFFEMHLNEWEPMHEKQLQSAIAISLKPTEFHLFEQGFRAVMTIMDAWWHNLLVEAMLHSTVRDNVNAAV